MYVCMFTFMAVGSSGAQGAGTPLFFRKRGLSSPKNFLSKHTSKVGCSLLVSIDLSIFVKIVINVNCTLNVKEITKSCCTDVF